MEQGRVFLVVDPKGKCRRPGGQQGRETHHQILFLQEGRWDGAE
jgi:hypothetical protein